MAVIPKEAGGVVLPVDIIILLQVWEGGVGRRYVEGEAMDSVTSRGHLPV